MSSKSSVFAQVAEEEGHGDYASMDGTTQAFLPFLQYAISLLP